MSALRDNLKGASMKEAFTETPAAIARAANVSVPTVRLYGDLGFIPFILSSSGTRLHRANAADVVRETLAKRLAKKGRKRG
jgi:DNA-binding transcriptional MerR regulator